MNYKPSTVDHLLYSYVSKACNNLYIRLPMFYVKLDNCGLRYKSDVFTSREDLVSGISPTCLIHSMKISNFKSKQYNIPAKMYTIDNINIVVKNMCVYIKLQNTVSYINAMLNIICVYRKVIDADQIECLIKNLNSVINIDSDYNRQLYIKIHKKYIPSLSRIKCEFHNFKEINHISHVETMVEIIQIIDSTVYGNFIMDDNLYICSNLFNKDLVYCSYNTRYIDALINGIKINNFDETFYSGIRISKGSTSFLTLYKDKIKEVKSVDCMLHFEGDDVLIDKLLYTVHYSSRSSQSQKYSILGNMVIIEDDKYITLIDVKSHPQIHTENKNHNIAKYVLESYLMSTDRMDMIVNDLMKNHYTDTNNGYANTNNDYANTNNNDDDTGRNYNKYEIYYVGSMSITNEAIINMDDIKNNNIDITNESCINNYKTLIDYPQPIHVIPILGDILQIWIFDERLNDIKMIDGYLLYKTKEDINNFERNNIDYINMFRRILNVNYDSALVNTNRHTEVEVECKITLKEKTQLFDLYNLPIKVHAYSTHEKSKNSNITLREMDNSSLLSKSLIESSIKLFNNFVKLTVSTERVEFHNRKELDSYAYELTRIVCRKELLLHGYKIHISKVYEIRDNTILYKSDVINDIIHDNYPEYKSKTELEIEFDHNLNLKSAAEIISNMLSTHTYYTIVQDDVEKYIEKLDSDESIKESIREFVMPRTLTLRLFNSLDESYVCTPKYDGDRVYLIHVDGCLFSYDRIGTFKLVLNLNHGNIITGNNIKRNDNMSNFIADCELVEETYYMFDCLAYKNLDLRLMGYIERYKFLQQIQQMMLNSTFNMEIKSIYTLNIENLKMLVHSGRIYNGDNNNSNNVKCDGVIFYKRSQRYNDFNELPIKWKYHNTIDLKYTSGMFYYHSPGKILTKLNVELSKDSDRSLLESNKIFECYIVDTTDSVTTIKIHRKRSDKEDPNSKATVDQILTLHKTNPISYESITFENIALMKSVHNIDKNTFMANGIIKNNKHQSIYGVVLDIGSGRGQDLGRYKNYNNRITHIYFVEKDPNEVQLLRSRIRGNIFDGKSTVINYDAGQIQKRMIEFSHTSFDVVNSFFTINHMMLSNFEIMMKTFINSKKITGNTHILLTMLDDDKVIETFVKSDNVPNSVKIILSQNVSTISTAAYTIKLHNTTEGYNMETLLLGRANSKIIETRVKASDVKHKLKEMGFKTVIVKYIDTLTNPLQYSSNPYTYKLYPDYIKMYSGCFCSIYATNMIQHRN